MLARVRKMLAWPTTHSSFPRLRPQSARSRKLMAIPQGPAKTPGLWSSQLRGSRLRRLLGSSSQTPVRSALCCLAFFPHGELTPTPASSDLLHAFPCVLSWVLGKLMPVCSLGAHNPGQRAAWMSPLFFFQGGYEGQGQDLPQPLLEGFGAIPQCSAHLAALLVDTCPPCTRDQAALRSSQASKPPWQQRPPPSPSLNPNFFI